MDVKSNEATLGTPITGKVVVEREFKTQKELFDEFGIDHVDFHVNRSGNSCRAEIYHKGMVEPTWNVILFPDKETEEYRTRFLSRGLYTAQNTREWEDNDGNKHEQETDKVPNLILNYIAQKANSGVLPKPSELQPAASNASSSSGKKNATPKGSSKPPKGGKTVF